jgi:hypothetical protein
MPSKVGKGINQKHSELNQFYAAEQQIISESCEKYEKFHDKREMEIDENDQKKLANKVKRNKFCSGARLIIAIIIQFACDQCHNESN